MFDVVKVAASLTNVVVGKENDSGTQIVIKIAIVLINIKIN